MSCIFKNFLMGTKKNKKSTFEVIKGSMMAFPATYRDMWYFLRNGSTIR